MRRRWKTLFKFGVALVILVAVYMYFATNFVGKYDEGDLGSRSLMIVDKDGLSDSVKEFPEGQNNYLQKSSDSQKSRHWLEGLHISVVSCGDRLEESLVMLKSAVLFSKSPLVFHIFAEDDLQQSFKDQLEFWPRAYRQKIEYYIYNLAFPQTPKVDQWKKLFKPCASQRLFLPSLLADVDAILYVDTDVLFLSSVDEIWSFFSKFNSSQLIAIGTNDEDPAIEWYNRFARHPFYGKLGVNSGVMLMNLSRLRQSSWMPAIENYYEEYRLNLTWGDQDLIKIYFHFYPHQLYVFSCEWNYRPNHCKYMSLCEPARNNGAYVLHGNMRAWHQDLQPAFKAVYTAFKMHDLGTSIEFDLLESLQKHLNDALQSNCGKVKDIFLKQIQTLVESKKSVSR